MAAYVASNEKGMLSKAIPLQAWTRPYVGISGVEASMIFRQMAHEGGKFVSPRHRLHLHLKI